MDGTTRHGFPARRRSARAGTRRRRRFWRLLGRACLLLLVAIVVAGVVWRDWVVAHARAAVVLAELLDVPVMQPIARALTGEPRTREIELAGAPTTLVSPAGRGPYPAILFITGADAAGRKQRDVQALARGLARAGYAVYVPDLPGLRDGEVSERTIDVANAAARAASERPESRGRRIAMASVSTGASLALSVAGEPAMRGRVSTVAGVAPFADIKGILLLATTGSYRSPGGELRDFETEPWMRQALARSLLAGLRDAKAPLPLVHDLERRSARSRDPLAPFRELPRGLLDADTQAVVDLLANTDPQRFDDLYRRLPAEVSDPIERLSPLPRARRLTMPVELASAPRDKYFPVEESRAIVEAAPNARLTVTSTLQHAQPEPSLAEIGDLVRFELFVVRFLHHAASTRIDP